MFRQLYDWGGLNVWLFHMVNDVHTKSLDTFMLLGTRLGDHDNFPIYFALITACGFIVAARGKPDRAIAWLSVLVVLSVGYVLDGGIIGLLKPWLDFPRPPLALPAGMLNIVGKAEFHHSLPSGHSAFAMLIAASLWPVSARLIRAVLIVFVLWVGLSRISLGAHFPADVLAGFMLSLMVVWLLRSIAQRIAHFY